MFSFRRVFSQLLTVALFATMLGTALGCTRGASDAGNGQPEVETTPATQDLTHAATEKSSAEKPAAAQKSPGGDAPAESPSADDDLPASCAKELREMRLLSAQVPRVFLDLKRPADLINADMVRCLSLCESFLKQCGDSQPACEVASLYGRMLMGRIDRYRQETSSNKKLTPTQRAERIKAYSEQIRHYAERGLDCDLPAAVADAVRSLLELAERAGDSLRALELSKTFLEKFPEHGLKNNVLFKQARSLIALERYEEAISLLRGVIDENVDTDDYAMFNISLFEALRGAGRLEEVEQLMERILVEYPLRVDTATRDSMRVQFSQWANVAKFWIGYVRYALGDADGAKTAFEEHAAETQSLLAELEQSGGAVDPVVKITLDFRTLDHILLLEDFHGKVPQVDLDFGEYWATDEKLSLAEERGNVVIILFRRPRERAATPFAVEAGRLYKEYKDKGLRFVMVGFLLGRPDAAADAEKLQNMRDELDELGLDIPAGYDPDREKHTFFRALHGTVGTASCVVIDRQGRIGYYIADPRGLDNRTLRRVVERLLNE